MGMVSCFYIQVILGRLDLADFMYGLVLFPGAARATGHGNQEFEMELQCRMGKLGPYADLSLSHSEHVPPIFLTPPCELIFHGLVRAARNYRHITPYDSCFSLSKRCGCMAVCTAPV